MGKVANVILMGAALIFAYHEGRKSMWMDYTKALIEVEAKKAEEKNDSKD